MAAGPVAGQVPVPGLTAAPETQTVVLLHGLGRTAGSMGTMARELEERGYRTVNISYPSRELSIDELVDTLRLEIQACSSGEEPVHFVTHSLGGIILRAYADLHGADRIGRVVMLSPPNGGSEVADRLSALEWLLGPAFVQLGTDSTGIHARLGAPAFEVGVITWDASLNPLFSWWLPGPDDGKVTVESARLEGMRAFLVVPHTHTFIMSRDTVIHQVIAFLGSGQFSSKPAESESR